MDHTSVPTLEPTYVPTTYPTYEPTYGPSKYPTTSPVVTANHIESEEDSHINPDGGYKYNLFMGLIIIAILCCVCMMISFWKNKKKTKNSYDTKSPEKELQKKDPQNLIMIHLKGRKQTNTSSMQSPTISRLSPVNTHTNNDSENERTNNINDSKKEALVENVNEKTNKKLLGINEDSESELLRKNNQTNDTWSSDSQLEDNKDEHKMDVYVNMDAEDNESDFMDEKSNVIDNNDEDVIKRWLTEIHSLEYFDTFVEHGFTNKKLSMIYHLDSSDLKEMGINKIADKKMILKHIYVLKNIVNEQNNSNDVQVEHEMSDDINWRKTECAHVATTSVNIIGHKNSITT
eukprot:257022_1